MRSRSRVPRVLVSLCSVPESPTASLITKFYKNLGKHPDKAQALSLEGDNEVQE
ncbi:MAG: CHAT domain-containing protein [Cyanobacteria bacterium P01_A01_bin.40]